MMLSRPTDRLKAGWARHRGWLLRDILAPFALTRLALIITGVAAQALPRDTAYPLAVAVQRGWQFVPDRLLDMWARWDSGWYIDIIARGYRVGGPLETVQSSLHFWPLYPFLAKAVLIVAPAATRGAALAAGLLVSNAMLLIALALLRQLVIEQTGDNGLARRSIWALLLFPTGFFLSAVYTESTYLCVLLAAWLMATRRRWAWAALFGALTALSRPPGVLLALPLALEYLSSIDWRPRRVRWGILAAAGPLLGLAIFLVLQMPISGDFLGPLKRSAFTLTFTWPWTTWLQPAGAPAGFVDVERFTALVMLVLLVFGIWRFRSVSLGVIAAFGTLAGLLSGSIIGYSRYASVTFPSTMAMAVLWKRRWLGIALGVVMAIAQLALFAAYTQFYPVL